MLLIDDPRGEVDGTDEPFELLRPEDLFDDRIELHRMETIYGLTELATSLKPWLLRHILDSGSDCAMYLDPDIRVFDRLDELSDLAQRSSIALIPHARAPIPRDGKMTSESAILATGVYNLGFIAVGPEAGAFLDFWQERLKRECLNDPTNMRFVDQRWVDFVPAMFDCAIVREPRFNVAYWNLHERDVCWTGDHYEVDGKPLGFFHFSGYSPESPHVLSRHQVERPRILLSDRPDLMKLCDEYGAALEAAGFGFADGSQNRAGYGLDPAPNGLRLDRHIRRLYLNWLLAWERGEPGVDPPPDPFDPVGARELVDWLNAVVENPVGPSCLTRYEGTLYAHTPDLRPRFADPQGKDFWRFVGWFEEEASAGRIDPLMVRSVQSRRADPSFRPNAPLRIGDATPDQTAGLNIAGYLDASHSIGELGRLTERAVEASGIDFQSVVYDPSDGSVVLLEDSDEKALAHSTRDQRQPADFGTNLVVVNADQLPSFATRVGASFFEGRYTIGCWAWELSTFPDRWADSFELVDEIWAISEFSRQSIASVTGKPVFNVAPPVMLPQIAPGVGREAFGLDRERFVFLFCFDLLSVLERKNPLGLIEAFTSAFGPGEGPLLVLKTVNGDTKPMDLEMIRVAAYGRDDIRVIDRHLEPGHLATLMSLTDCYVSLHRSEGLGLTMAESMLLAKPVIATGYSGNLEFMTEENSFLVPHTWAQVPEGCDPYPRGAQWAEPDLAAAAQMMRRVVEDPAEASRRAQRGRADLERDFGIPWRAEVLRRRFQDAETRRLAARGREAMSSRRRTAVATARSVARGLGAVERRVGALERRLSWVPADGDARTRETPVRDT